MLKVLNLLKSRFYKQLVLWTEIQQLHIITDALTDNRKHLHSWLTRAAKWAWPRGCGIALKKAKYVLWKTCLMNPCRKTRFPKLDYVGKLSLPLQFSNTRERALIYLYVRTTTNNQVTTLIMRNEDQLTKLPREGKKKKIEIQMQQWAKGSKGKQTSGRKDRYDRPYEIPKQLVL